MQVQAPQPDRIIAIADHCLDAPPSESLLVREFYELMMFYPIVDDVLMQPARVAYLSKQGAMMQYAPEALVIFKSDPETGLRPPSLLVEINYRKAYRNTWPASREKLKALRQYAKGRGWNFKVVTDREIRKTAFSNLSFLAAFRERTPNQHHLGKIRTQMVRKSRTHARELLSAITRDSSKQMEIVQTLWWMVANSKLQVDIFKPISMHSVITLHIAT